MKGEITELEFDSAAPIEEVKQKIFAEKGYEVNSQKLIHRGKSLENGRTLQEYQIVEGDTLILMVSKPTTKSTTTGGNEMDIENPAPQVAPQQPVQGQTQPANPARPAPAQAQQQPAGGAQAGLPFGMTQAQVDERINDLIAITGTDRDQALAALRAAFFDVNTAANFVFEGIPPHLVGGGAGGAGVGAGAGAGGLPQDGGEDDGEDGGLNDPANAQAIQELNQLVSNPAFQQLRQQARANP